MDYSVIRSRRKTIAAQVKGGRLIIRAPEFMPDIAIRLFIAKNKIKIEEMLRRAESSRSSDASSSRLTEQELNDLKSRAKAVFSERAAYYAKMIGVTYGRITIRSQHTRWGSCSSKGNLNFNCLLLLAPPEVLDSVVVHELCHRKEMNHSAAFYKEVLRVFPDYKKWQKWLKDNGPALIARLP